MLFAYAQNSASHENHSTQTKTEMAFESPLIGAEIEGQKLCEKIAAKLCENVLNNKEPKFGGTNTCFRAKQLNSKI